MSIKRIKSKSSESRAESGQTLIETILAIFLLTTALTTGLGLAIYALNSSATSQSQIVASNLAREGIEVARMMRDSNWLASESKGGPWGLQLCDDLGVKNCYPRAYQKVPSYNDYDLDSGNQRAVYNSSGNTWSLEKVASYNLFLQADGSFTHRQNGSSNFARMINLSFNSASPYTNQNSNQELIIKSVVAWRGKNCPAFATSQDLLIFLTPCKVVVEEHLTNWKDY